MEDGTIVLNIEHTVGVEGLASLIADNLTYDETLDLLKRVDELMCDWEFTEKARKYFSDMMEEKEE